VGTAVLLLVAAALGAGIGVLLVLRPRRKPEPPPLEIPAEPVDAAAVLRETVDGTPELRALYVRLGFPPEVERSWERLLGELEGQVRAEIPDFAAFRAALAEADTASPDAGFFAEDVELLREVIRAGENREEVLRLLDRDPVGRLLPFIERIALTRNGERVWRTPVELSLLRKRPASPEVFERKLDELEKLLRSSVPSRVEAARNEAIEALARARRDTRRDGAYMPTSLRALRSAVEAWWKAAPLEARRRREELDGLLLGLLRVRRGPSGAGAREEARAQADRYAGAAWMHTPWITAYALTNLLDAELSALPEEERRQPSPRAATLRWVRDEVASSHFDGEETIRRLRQQEERELFVHSLVYALLRMSRVA
jgi:hypothetical protein